MSNKDDEHTERVAKLRTFRTELSAEQRASELNLGIDPGFVHHRKINALLGQKAAAVLQGRIGEVSTPPNFLELFRIDHAYTDYLVGACHFNKVPTLESALNRGPEQGLFCSVELPGPARKLKGVDRAVVKWQCAGQSIEMQYDTTLVRGSTLDLRLGLGGNHIAVIAEYRRERKRVLCEPFVMGFPVLRLENGRDAAGWAPFFGTQFYEQFLEDFDEFEKVTSEPLPKDSEPMRHVSENAFKQCVAQILGGTVTADWGGETSDFYSAHIHIKGRRTTGAFLFKGPAHFRPMGLNHLGKNNDQLVRLCDEPAGVFFVQHSHDILTPVRKTLRALAVQPGNPRRYALVDGRESLRLLRAYGLFEQAVEFSRTTRKSVSPKKKN